MIYDTDIFRNIPHLQLLQNQREPAWLWDIQDHIILWANMAGLVFWNEPDLSRLKKRRFDHAMPALMRLTELANLSWPEERITESLLFWTAHGPRQLECTCTPLKMENGTGGILLHAVSQSSSQTQSDNKAIKRSLPVMKTPPQTPISMQDQATLKEIAEMMADPSRLGDFEFENNAEHQLGQTDDAQSQSVPFVQDLNSKGHHKKGNGAYEAFGSTSHELTSQANQISKMSFLSNSAFFAKISHEVRTPLNSIIGFAEIMKEERFGTLNNEKYKGYITDIFESAHLALSLINDLLDISKIEAGHFKVIPANIDLNATIETCISSLQPQAAKNRLIFRQSLAANLPKVVFDQRNLKQVLLNLLSNAIKATQPGGQIITSTLLHKDGSLRLRIRDTGIGMSAADLEVAMQPFQQLDDQQGTLAPLMNGTGLGLPLTKALVEANKARFLISSTPGKGTLAEIVFPKAS